MISKKTLRQLMVFGFIGVLATVIHYLVALASHEHLQINMYIANLLGYACAVALSYIGHGKLTFRVALSRQVFQRFIVDRFPRQ
jgi:putative flippase GtrA